MALRVPKVVGDAVAAGPVIEPFTREPERRPLVPCPVANIGADQHQRGESFVSERSSPPKTSRPRKSSGSPLHAFHWCAVATAHADMIGAAAGAGVRSSLSKSLVAWAHRRIFWPIFLGPSDGARRMLDG